MTFSRLVDIPPILYVIDDDICLSGFVTMLVNSAKHQLSQYKRILT